MEENKVQKLDLADAEVLANSLKVLENAVRVYPEVLGYMSERGIHVSYFKDLVEIFGAEQINIELRDSDNKEAPKYHAFVVYHGVRFYTLFDTED